MCLILFITFRRGDSVDGRLVIDLPMVNFDPTRIPSDALTVDQRIQLFDRMMTAYGRDPNDLKQFFLLSCFRHAAVGIYGHLVTGPSEFVPMTQPMINVIRGVEQSELQRRAEQQRHAQHLIAVLREVGAMDEDATDEEDEDAMDEDAMDEADDMEEAVQASLHLHARRATVIDMTVEEPEAVTMDDKAVTVDPHCPICATPYALRDADVEMTGDESRAAPGRLHCCGNLICLSCSWAVDACPYCRRDRTT
jgi:hypothetical protein